jgi:hypothetical protein
VWSTTSFHSQRTSAAHAVFEQLDGDSLSDGEIIERRGFVEIAPMEVDLAAEETDEPVALSRPQVGDATGRRDAG